ncbi:MAG: ribosomal-protein-alanine N-acetyltransferase [Arcobacteraceae bacterium]|jgi:ribosomal-protein-alanine N-acetyltransferase
MIKKASLSNVKELFILESSIFSKEDFGLNLSSFYYHIKRNNLFICVKNKKTIGYILWLKRKNYFKLYSICVDSEYREKGIAQKLLDFSYDFLKSDQYILEVKISNTKAIHLYEINNFFIKKILINFYSNNNDGYLMIRKS